MRERWRIWKNPETGERTNYKVSSKGRVRNRLDGHDMHIVVNVSGYELVHVTLSRNKDRMMLVHRMVAQAFIPNPNDYKEIDHIDHNRRNNQVTNLRWVSREENQKNKRGKRIRPVSCYTLDGGYVATYKDCTRACEAVGLTNGLGIRAVAEGWQQTAGGYLWKWADSQPTLF